MTDWKEYYKKNRKKMIERQKAYYRRNRKKRLEYSKIYNVAYYKKNKKKLNKKTKEYYQENRENILERRKNRSRTCENCGLDYNKNEISIVHNLCRDCMREKKWLNI